MIHAVKMINDSELDANETLYSNATDVSLGVRFGDAATRASTVQAITSFYLTPVIVMFGIAGNVLNILILTQKQSSLSTMALLIALSIMDLMVLVVQAPFILMTLFEDLHEIVFTINAYFVCYIRYPITCTGLSAIAWLSAAVSVERFFAITSVENSNRSVTCNAKMAPIAIIVASFLLNASKFFHYSVNTSVSPGKSNSSRGQPVARPYCLPAAIIRNTLYSTIVDYLAGLLNTIIPTVIMAIFGAMIIYKLMQVKRQRRVILGRTNSREAKERNAKLSAQNSPVQPSFSKALYSKLSKKLPGATVQNEELGTAGPFRKDKEFLYSEKAVQKQTKTNAVSGRERDRGESSINLATRMVIATVCLFIFSGSLSLYLTIASAVFGQNTLHGDTMTSLKHISNLLTITNASFNFSLYCCTCAQYRAALVRLFQKSSAQKSPKSNQSRTNGTIV